MKADPLAGTKVEWKAEHSVEMMAEWTAVWLVEQ